jgi:hypothetical protein
MLEKLPLVGFFSLRLLIIARTKLKKTVQTAAIKKCLTTSNLNFLHKVQKSIFFEQTRNLFGGKPFVML